MAQGTAAARMKSRQERSSARWLGRGAWSLAAVLLLGWLGWLVARPFWHPRTHLVLLAGDIAPSASASAFVPADYVLEDLRAFFDLKNVLYRGVDGSSGPLVLGSLGHPDEMQHLTARLNERLTGNRDALMVYATAHGLSQDGDAWLLASGADPDAVLSGRYRLSGLLASLKACEASTKVLILDAGRIDYDPLRGLVDNDFSARLTDQVEQLGDASLWVLVSHAAGQRSHVSAALRRSVFGYFVAEGLKGSADLDSDRSIDLGELTQFVSASVRSWVHQTTGGAAEQTPSLVFGQGRPWPGQLPTLLAVRKESATEPRKIDHAKTIEEARTSTKVDDRIVAEGKGELNTLIASSLARATPQGRLGHYASDVARKAISNVVSKAPKVPATSTDTKTPSKSAEPSGKTESAVATTESSNAAAPPKGDAQAAVATKDSSATKEEPKSETAGKAKPAQAADKPAVAQPVKRSTITREQLAAQLHRAWLLRDEAAAPTRVQIRAMDYAPLLWRDLEHQLLAMERVLRTGYFNDIDQLAGQADEVLQTLEWLTGAAPARLPPNLLAGRFATARPGLAWAKTEAHSLALAELIAQQGGPAVSQDLLTWMARLDEQIATGNRSDLARLAQNLKTEHDRWIELRVLRMLASRADLDWRLVQMLLAVTRASEDAAAASLAAPAWQRPELERADAMRLSAERELLARGSFDREALLASLTEAVEAYQNVKSNLAAIQAAQRLTHDVWHRLPQYLAWNAAAQGSSGIGPTAEELASLIAELGELEVQLTAPASDRVAAVRQSSERLKAAQTSVEKGLDPLVVEQLLLGPVAPGEAWRIEVLLETTLPTADVRQALVASLPEIDAAIASQVRPIVAADVTSAPPLLRTDFDRFASRASLQHKVWHAALRGVVNLDLEALDIAWRLWVEPREAGGAANAVSLSTSRDRFETALADLARGLPARLQKGAEQEQDLSVMANRLARISRLHAWDRALRLVDPRLANQVGDSTPTLVLTNAAAYDLLSWLHQRARNAGEDAPPQTGAYLDSVADAYRVAAAAIPRQPMLHLSSTAPLVLTGPDQVALTYESEQQVQFMVRNNSSTAIAGWLVGEWEPEFVSLTSTAQHVIHPWTNWQKLPQEGADQGPAALKARGRPTLELAPGQAIAIPIRIARQKPALTSSPIVLRAVTDAHIARHDLVISLPPPEDVQLAVAGLAARWAPGSTGATLFPFPNRVSSFVLELASGQAAERKVDVEVFPVLSLPPRGIPSVPLSEADAARLHSELNAGPLVAEARSLVLPPSGKRVSIPLLVPQPKAPQAGAAAPSAASSAADEKNKSQPPMGDKPPPVPLTEGLLIVVTDLADTRQTFKHIEIAPQRPQRYVKPQVRYRAGRERIEIRVSPQDAALLPAGGVRIHGEIAESLAPDAVRQLDAVLTAQADAEMHVEIPSTAGGVATLRLTVDDYPRAIYYRVPTSGETSDVPEDMDLLAVRIAELPKGTIYRPPTAAIPLQLEIDAPASALKSPPLRVEIGIDRDRDRELRGDEIVVLTTDRQVEAALVGVSKAGALEIEARVKDFAIDLPAGSLVNGRANVLAHAILGEKEAWSEPIEIVVDGQAPRVSAVELRPDRVAVIGSDLLVSALADDLGLSGVAALEAMFDLDRSGQFGPMAKPVAGALRDDGRWAAKVPTAGLPSGAHNVLVRAVDRAGNASEPVRASVRLLSAEEAAADSKAKNSAEITGVVMYGDQPQAGMKVFLAADTGAPPAKADMKKKKDSAKATLASTTTDAQGQFRFPKVAPGKYAVSAEGLVRNNNRTAEQAVAFEKPQDVQPLTLKLK